MAGTIRCLSKITFGLFNNNVHRQLTFNGCRTLYTEATLGLTDYVRSRDNYQDRYKNSLDSFRTKIKEGIESEKNLIFTEDLKALLHIVEKNPDDVKLLKAALEKFNDQDKEIRFGYFRFGPVVMRCFHHLNEPNIAFETFKNPKFQGFYDQQTTFAVLADLLYENQMYSEVIELYDIVKNNYPSGVRNPKLLISVLAVACYKLNTPESLQFGLKVFKDMTDKDIVPLRRVVSTLAALAIKQNAPHYALEILSVCMKTDYISIRSLKVMALCDLDRLDDVARELETAIKRGMPMRNRYFSDVVEKVETAISKDTADSGKSSDIRELLEVLKTRDYIDQKTIEEHITEPIDAQRGPMQTGSMHSQRRPSEFEWTQRKKVSESWYSEGDEKNQQNRSNESGGFRRNWGSS